jgi:hypothetical protein
MNAADQEQWRAQHIPHRLRACLTGLPLQHELTKTIEDEKIQESTIIHCLSRTVSEGRMAAIRWLIEFIGVGERKKGKPGRPNRRGNDVSINMIGGGKEIDLDSHEAEILADVWKGCSQARRASYARHRSSGREHSGTRRSPEDHRGAPKTNDLLN